MLLINNKYSLDLMINGRTIGATDSAIVKSLKIYESMIDRLPIMELHISLPTKFIEDYPIVDGTPIRVGINYNVGGTAMNYNKPMNFRVFDYSFSESNSSGMLNYSIQAVYDVYQMFAIAENYDYSTASSLFKKVASDLKLDADIATTTDAQVWLSKGQSLLKFLDEVCLHSYRAPDSIMTWYINRYGKLILKDITQDIRGRINWYFMPQISEGKVNENQMIYSGPTYQVSSGLNNTYQGYGVDSHYFDILGNSLQIIHPKEFYKSSNYINVNKVCSQTQRHENVGFNSGNVHSNYFLAQAQNKRGKALYSTFIQFRVESPRDVLLGDIGSYYMDVNRNENDKSYTGSYIVSRVVSEMTTSTFVNYIELMGQGVNNRSTELY